MADTQKELEKSLRFRRASRRQTADTAPSRAGATGSAGGSRGAAAGDRRAAAGAPAAVTEKDFAAAEAEPPNKPAKKAAKKNAPKQAGGDA